MATNEVNIREIYTTDLESPPMPEVKDTDESRSKGESPV